MPGRAFFAGNAYRYGFNGKEKDLETAETTTYDYGFRIYNPGLGRFLSVDPLMKVFSWWSPYHFAGNTPIVAIDLDGKEIFVPRVSPTIWRPTITIPKIRPIVLPREVIMPPPGISSLPKELTVGQDKVNSNEVENSTPIDWSFPPPNPESLSDKWEEFTDPRNISGSRDFRNKENLEEIIRFDKGREGEPGWRGIDHWHRLNPKKTGKKDMYLDKEGNPTPKNSEASHLEASKIFSFPTIQIESPKPTRWEKFKKAWKEFWRVEKEKKEYDA